MPRNALLYHFTHERNLERIIREGRLVSDRTARSEDRVAVDVGDRAIKSRRRVMKVTSGPEGCPADYVPFYFAPRSPMLYRISRGGVPEYQAGQDPLVYVVTDVEHVIATGRPFVFSDGNCAHKFTAYSDNPAQLDVMVDWPLMRERLWSDTPEDPDRKRRRMAEFLVHQYVPWSAVIYLGARTEVAARRVDAMAARLTAHRTPVLIRSTWYF